MFGFTTRSTLLACLPRLDLLTLVFLALFAQGSTITVAYGLFILVVITCLSFTVIVFVNVFNVTFAFVIDFLAFNAAIVNDVAVVDLVL